MSREEILVLEVALELTLEALLDVVLELTELELLLDATLEAELAEEVATEEADEALDVLAAAEDELALLCAELEVLLALVFVAVLPAELEDEESPPPPPPPQAASRLSSRQGRAFFKARDFMLDSSKVSG